MCVYMQKCVCGGCCVCAQGRTLGWSNSSISILIELLSPSSISGRTLPFPFSLNSSGFSFATTISCEHILSPEILFHPTKRCRINEGADATVYSSPSSLEVSGKFCGLPSEMYEEDGLARAVSLFAMVLKRVKSKMKSVANKRSAEILTSVATEMHLQL